MHKFTYSILRTEEDNQLSGLLLRGRVLDLGGHKGSSYFSLLTSDQSVEVANFDAATPGTHKTASGADHIFDFEKPFPLPDQSFDTVLCINVLEHIYYYEQMLQECARIMKPNGALYLSVPFFFNIHASPNDYFRYTRSALERILGDAGFATVEVVPLGYGPCSVLFQTFGGSIPTMPLKLCFKNLSKLKKILAFIIISASE